MTKLLKKAFSEASRLSDKEQDLLAERVLAEIKSDRRWGELFAGSEDELSQLATETLAKHRFGKTQRLDSNKQ